MAETASKIKSNVLSQVEKGESLWVGAWHRLRKNKMALLGSIFIILLIGFSFIGPFFLEDNYYTYQELEQAMNNSNSLNRSKYLEIRKLNLHKMEAIPVCKIPK